MRAYQLTNHLNLFKNVYWGNWTITSDNRQAYQEQALARDKLVEQFQIVSSARSKLSYHFQEFGGDVVDHLEIYRTRTGSVVVVFSPYKGRNDNLPPKLMRLGFTMYATLYDPGCITWVAEFPGPRELSRLMKGLSRES